jgi:hypothetical protein
MEGSGELQVVFDKTPVVVSHAQKLSDSILFIGLFLALITTVLGLLTCMDPCPTIIPSKSTSFFSNLHFEL